MEELNMVFTGNKNTTATMAYAKKIGEIRTQYGVNKSDAEYIWKHGYEKYKKSSANDRFWNK